MSNNNVVEVSIEMFMLELKKIDSSYDVKLLIISEVHPHTRRPTARDWGHH